MKTEGKGTGSQDVDIARENAETCTDEDGTDIKRVFHIVLGTRDREKFILLQMARRPNAYGLSEGNQKDAYNHPWQVGPGKNDQQKSPDKERYFPKLFHIHRTSPFVHGRP